MDSKGQPLSMSAHDIILNLAFDPSSSSAAQKMLLSVKYPS